jgi:cytidine deaminase
MDIDWTALRAAATEAMRNAYAPYSKFPVGVAALVDDGRIVRGCNVENASYGLTLCAECGAVSALHATGGGRLIALSCVDGNGVSLMPCGRCRQLLWEHGGPDLLVMTGGEPIPMADLLPMAFDANAFDVADEISGVHVDRRASARDQPGSHLRDMLGHGTVFVHPDTVDGQRAWTAYWDGSVGESRHTAGDQPGAPAVDVPAPAARQAAILDEAPTTTRIDDAIDWGLARTRRVIVVDADGELFWAGEGPAPIEVPRPWSGSQTAPRRVADSRPDADPWRPNDSTPDAGPW